VLAHDSCPLTAGLWWTFSPKRGAWIHSSPAGVRSIRSGLELLAMLRAFSDQQSTWLGSE